MTAEEYIKEFTRSCSNELENGEYEYWLTPWQAEEACNLAREEVRKQFEKEQLKHHDELITDHTHKEVDLEKELKNLIGNVGQCDRKVAKHFFELGLNTNKVE